MYSPIVRIIIAGVALILAWKSYSTGNMTGAFIVLGAIGLIVWGYFKNGTVYLAFQQIKKENYDKAQELLLKVYKPELLQKSQKSYYHFIKGFIELHRQNTDSAYNELSMALNLGLKTQNDTSIVTLNLASIELERKNPDEALNFLKRTKKLNYKPELSAEIERLEAEITAAQHSV